MQNTEPRCQVDNEATGILSDQQLLIYERVFWDVCQFCLVAPFVFTQSIDNLFHPFMNRPRIEWILSDMQSTPYLHWCYFAYSFSLTFLMWEQMLLSTFSQQFNIKYDLSRIYDLYISSKPEAADSNSSLVHLEETRFQDQPLPWICMCIFYTKNDVVSYVNTSILRDFLIDRLHTYTSPQVKTILSYQMTRWLSRR